MARRCDDYYDDDCPMPADAPVDDGDGEPVDEHADDAQTHERCAPPPPQRDTVSTAYSGSAAGRRRSSSSTVAHRLDNTATDHSRTASHASERSEERSLRVTISDAVHCYGWDYDKGEYVTERIEYLPTEHPHATAAEIDEAVDGGQLDSSWSLRSAYEQLLDACGGGGDGECTRDTVAQGGRTSSANAADASHCTLSLPDQQSIPTTGTQSSREGGSGVSLHTAHALDTATSHSRTGSRSDHSLVVSLTAEAEIDEPADCEQLNSSWGSKPSPSAYERLRSACGGDGERGSPANAIAASHCTLAEGSIPTTETLSWQCDSGESPHTAHTLLTVTEIDEALAYSGELNSWDSSGAHHKDYKKCSVPPGNKPAMLYKYNTLGMDERGCTHVPTHVRAFRAGVRRSAPSPVRTSSRSTCSTARQSAAAPTASLADCVADAAHAVAHRVRTFLCARRRRHRRTLAAAAQPQPQRPALPLETLH